MTSAFGRGGGGDPLLQQRGRRLARNARLKYLASRAARLGLWLLATVLLACVVIGFAEARYSLDSNFDWPWQWLPRVMGGVETRPIAPLTGSVLVLLVGGWLSYGGVSILRRLLRLGFGPLAVARNVVEEAIRNRVILLTLGLLLVALAWWPLRELSSADPQPVRYQVQSFLSFSSGIAALLLGAATVLFSGFSVAGDLQARRAGDVFVKPLGRPAYLFGKWIGVVSLMAVVLGVQFLVTWGVAAGWLGTGLPADEADARALRQRVLTARDLAPPQPETPFAQTASERLRGDIEANSELLQRRGQSNLFNDYVNEALADFLSIPPGESQTYVFEGLGEAKRRADRLEQVVEADREQIASRLAALGVDVPAEAITAELLATEPGLAQAAGVDVRGATLQFRFKVRGSNTYNTIRWGFVARLNGRLVNGGQPVVFPIDSVQVFDLPATYVDENGRLELEIANVLPPPTQAQAALTFDPETGVNILYAESSFAANLLRGTFVQWLRLGFLAMLGVVTASLLSYPVAAVTSLSIWLLAAGGSWLLEVLSSRVADTGVAAIDRGFNDLLLGVVSAAAWLFSRFSQTPVGESLTDGRSIGYGAVAWDVLWIGLLWTGGLLLIGSILFGRREIARVQV